MSYSQWRNYGTSHRYEKKSIKKDPLLQARIEVILKEDLDNRSKDFVESLLKFCTDNGGLTDRQLNSFKKIESRFSPGEKAKLLQWAKEYTANHLADAKVLAKYYSTTGYWSELSESILKDSNYIPPKWKYEKMSKNKYAEKILNEGTRAAKFGINEMIQVRSTAGNAASDPRIFRKLRNRLCFVIDNSLPIKSPVNGGKRYKVLPMGHSEAIEIEERHIMKPNKRGKAI